MRQPCAHLAERNHDDVDDDSHDDVSDEQRGGSEFQRVTGTDDETGADGASDGHHVWTKLMLAIGFPMLELMI